MKKFLTFLISLCALALSAGEVKFKVESMKMEGFYRKDSFLKGTKEKFSAYSQIKAKEGWNEIEVFNHFFKPEALTDGNMNYKGYVGTYAWSSHRKRLILVLDVERQQFIDQVLIWNNTNSRLRMIFF